MNTKPIQRTFIPGSEWIYYKIYSGTTTATMLLTELILPFTQELLKTNKIELWFFIRYADPDSHLRVRFLCKNVSYLGEIISAFQQNIQSYVDQGLVWKLQIDTYQRELERYGANTIEASEKLFFYDSLLIVKALDLIEDKELVLFSVLKVIDLLLTEFKLDTTEKLNLVQINGTAFKKEFNADKNLRKQLDKKYRNYRSDIEIFLALRQHDEYQLLLNLINQHRTHIKSIANYIFDQRHHNNLKVSIENLLSSYIHMHINRFFDTRQRLYEMLCYDFLIRYYKNLIGKEKSNNLLFSKTKNQIN